MHENASKESLQKHACSMTGGAQPRWVLHHHVDDIAAQPMQRRILRSSKTNLQKKLTSLGFCILGLGFRASRFLFELAPFGFRQRVLLQLVITTKHSNVLRRDVIARAGGVKRRQQ
jgi:hypothetical protein